jgi:hypothetical protein
MGGAFSGREGAVGGLPQAREGRSSGWGEPAAPGTGRLPGADAPPLVSVSPARAELETAARALGHFALSDRSGMDAGELLACLDLVVGVAGQAESLTAAVAEEAKRKGAAAKTEGLDVESHLKMKSNMPAAQAKRLVKQGEALRPFEVVSRAAQMGKVAPTQAQAVARELGDFPSEVLGDKALREAEAELVREASRLGTKELAAKTRELVDQARRLAGVGGDRRDRLDREHQKAHRERYLSFKRDGQAMVIRGRCPVDVGARIRRRLEGAALAARRERTDKANGGDPDAGRLWDPTASGREDSNAFGASMLDALAAMADAYPREGAPLSAGKPARIVVTITKDQLGFPAPMGVLSDDGEPLAPEALNQLLCGAEWLAVLMGSFGEPLDVGRSTRAIPPAIRLALSQRDGGCCFPGCGVGPDGCEAHHLRKWVLGGNTSLDNLVLACHRHHRLLEPAAKLPDGTPWFPGCDDPGRWRAEIDPIHHHPVVIPPARVDPQRKPMLNDRILVKLENLGVTPKPKWSRPSREDSARTAHAAAGRNSARTADTAAREGSAQNAGSAGTGHGEDSAQTQAAARQHSAPTAEAAARDDSAQNAERAAAAHGENSARTHAAAVRWNSAGTTDGGAGGPQAAARGDSAQAVGAGRTVWDNSARTAWDPLAVRAATAAPGGSPLDVGARVSVGARG